MSPPEKREEESPVPPVAGERTWTIKWHDPQDFTEDAVLIGPAVKEDTPVVELSRLRAAEERADTWEMQADEYREVLGERAGMALAERDRLAETLDEFDRYVSGTDGDYEGSPFQTKVREALASLEQKEDG